MERQSNPQLELAHDYVTYTNKNIFLTGRAGTGKTTFLHSLKESSLKRMAVVAPTGVAAINAGGMTIHSLFQLPFGPFLPENAREASRQRRFSREKIRLIQSLDLLVIDEISMVRADLLDAIDDVLRRYRRNPTPFGGLQLLMIGDLHQLPPVVKDEEWDLLRAHYHTPYFFGSRALQETRPVAIELKHIYRQSDDVFIKLLNRVRGNELDAAVLEQLNSRFIPDFQPPPDQPYITLSSHNASARAINAQKLAALPGALLTYKAVIKDDFPAHAYPTDEVLECKVGAQVMFIKNDPSREKLYYNGKIGQITRVQGATIYVQCPGDFAEIAVEPVEWQNLKYALDEATKEVQEEIVGTFTQYPLRLAWAITIHKSQGLTFERAIIDAQAAFAHGQVYVALSRCKSFEGIVLCSRITPSSVKTDETVRSFTAAAERNAPDQSHLQQSKAEFQRSLILELFSFQGLKRALERLNRVFMEHEGSFLSSAITQFKTLSVETETQLFTIADKFGPQLQYLALQPGLPEENQDLQERLRKACAWFGEKMEQALWPAVQALSIVTDNKTVRKSALEALENLQREFYINRACLKAIAPGFATQAFLRARSDAEIDFKANVPSAAKPTHGQSSAPRDAAHPELYALLQRWRDDTAELEGVPAFQVLSTKSLVELTKLLPADVGGLKKVYGIGPGKSKRYGPEILEIIHAYCLEQGVESTQMTLAPPPKPKPPKVNTKQLSYELFKAGKSIDEVAQERGLTRSTIEGHLTHFIAMGELDLLDALEEEKWMPISQYFTEQGLAIGLSEAKAALGDDFTYGEIKMVQKFMQLHEGQGDGDY
jgi:hypothetical protein